MGQMYSGEDFIKNKVQTNEKVDWGLIAYDVLCSFARERDETSSLKLLLVMEKTNPEAAEIFGNALTKGKETLFQSSSVLTM